MPRTQDTHRQMPIKRRSLIWHKYNALLRYVMMHTATRVFPLYIVNEYPKSGGSWIGEMLSDALHVPFPRNRLPVPGRCILHGHVMQSWNMHNVLLVWRDGRDVLVSQYYHWLFRNDRDNARLVDICRRDLNFSDYEDVRANLPAFMEYVYERKRHPRMSWADFVDRWVDCASCVHVRYEEMRSTPVEELCRIASRLGGKELDPGDAANIVDAHAFEKLSGRLAGEENTRSFMRKGMVGDWNNYFSKEARELFHGYAGAALVKLGYETDDAWLYEREPETT